MNVIPVLDLLNGVVVRGIAGQRDRYRPIHSTVAPSPDASVVMTAIRETFGLQYFYVADLDAIQFQRLNRCTISELSREDVSLMVDRGVRHSEDVEELLELGVDRVVVALETFSEIKAAEQLIHNFGSERLVLSLDMQDGQLKTAGDEWENDAPLNVAEKFAAVGFDRMIVLDLAGIGMSSGTPTLSLCKAIGQAVSELRLITGGGIRGMNDLRELESIGVESALVASALHDGALTPEDLQSWL